MRMIDWRLAARGICLWGAIILLWNVYEAVTEQSHIAELSDCKTNREYDSTLIMPSEGITMLSCNATYTIDEKLKTVALKSKLPTNFNTYTNVKIVTQSFGGSNARLASASRDWDDTLIKVLFFEFIGAMLLLKKK